MLLSVKCANGHICRVVAKINVLLIRFYRNFVSCFGFFSFFLIAIPGLLMYGKW